MDKPLIAIFSDANFLGTYLVENFLAKFCEVLIFTSDKKNWEEKVSHIANRNNLEILEQKEFSRFPSFNYALFLNGFIKKEKSFDNFQGLYRNQIFKNTKTIAIFPLDLFDQKISSALPVNSNLSVIYTSDLLGPRIDLESGLLLPTLINESIQKRTLTLGVGEVFYPLFVSDLAKSIVKWVFSFGPYGKEIFVLGSQISGSTLWTELKKSIPGLNVVYDSNIQIRNIPRGYEVKNIDTNISMVFRETFNWIVSRQVKIPEIINRPEVKRKKEFKISNPKLLKIRLIITLAILFLVFPFLCMGGVAGLYYMSYKNFFSGKADSSRNLLLLSKTLSIVGKEESRFLRQIPILNLIYRETFYALELTEKLADVSVNSIYLAESGRELFDKILGDQIYDPEKISKDIVVNLDYLYKGVSLIQINTQSAISKKSVLANKVVAKADFERVKRLFSEGSKIAKNLPSILGKDQRRAYLLLFQNNMELRPTGGFIGSFGILTLEGGRMTDLSVSDVYSADGQLNGHIEPPEPIKNYLGEANWFLRDSNWDPSFPISAERAEWFLIKEIDKKVDGVISIDLNIVKKLLSYTGPIYLSDYNMDITEENIYLKTQEEVHEDFFPGTHKKASFLTTLSRNMVTEVSKLDSGKKIRVLKEIFDNLEGRHVQVYLHDNVVQNAISSLVWSGEVLTPSCTGNCYTDFYGVVEANVGVNKANYFIKRSQSLTTELSGSVAKNTLTIKLNNTANPSLGLAGKYKSYVRVIIPEGAEVTDVFEVSGQNVKKIDPETYPVKGRQEVGFLVEVLGEQTKQIVVSWENPINLDFSKPGEYRLYARKQAGVSDEDPLTVKLSLPVPKINSSSKFTLTRDGQFVYNTVLARDFYSRISW